MHEPRHCSASILLARLKWLQLGSICPHYAAAIFAQCPFIKVRLRKSCEKAGFFCITDIGKIRFREVKVARLARLRMRRCGVGHVSPAIAALRGRNTDDGGRGDYDAGKRWRTGHK